MNKGKKLYEGKAKIIYETNDKTWLFSILKMMRLHSII